MINLNSEEFEAFSIEGKLDLILQNLHGVSPETRELALERLQSLPRLQSGNYLASLLTHSDPYLRIHAAEASLIIDSANSVRRVLPLLDDPIQWVRWNLCDWLSELGNSDATSALIKVVLQDTDADVRFMAAIALGKVGGPEALPALEQIAANDFEVDFQGDPISKAAHRAIADIRKRSQAGGLSYKS